MSHIPKRMVYTVHLGRWEVSLDQEKSIAEDVEQRDQIERAKERKWTGRSRGNPLGYRIFAWLLQFFGLRAAYTLLFFVGMYYMFFAPSTLRASSEYLQKIHGPLPWWKRLWMNYNHILYFGQVIIDRMAGAMGVIGTQLHFTEDGVEKIEEMMQLDTGAILLSAHVGNWDLAGRMLTGKVDKKIHVVMLQAEAEQLQGFFDSINSQPSFEIIVKGLKGGHSGMDIHLERGNANKIMNPITCTVSMNLSDGFLPETIS